MTLSFTKSTVFASDCLAQCLADYFLKPASFILIILLLPNLILPQNGEKITQCEIKVIVLTCIFLHIPGVKISWQDNYAGYLPINFYGEFGLILA